MSDGKGGEYNDGITTIEERTRQTQAEVEDELRREIEAQMANGTLPQAEGQRQLDRLTKHSNSWRRPGR